MKSRRLALYIACTLPLLAMNAAGANANGTAPKLVVSTCSGCHGVDGNAKLPYIPKLAGMQAAYMEKKMYNFQEPVARSSDDLLHWIIKPSSMHNVGGDTREAQVNMLGISLSTNEVQLHEAADWYEKQTPSSGHAGKASLVSQGGEIFLNGLPKLHITACKTCHGEKALGNAAAPLLAGQNGEYIVSQLAKFGKGDRKHAPEMTMVVRDLDANQARAVAAYLQAQ